MNEKVDMKEGCARLSFLFVVTKWQDNNVIYIVYYVQILNLCMMGAKGVHIMAFNTGHEGSLGSVHANSPEDVILRIESMVRMANDIPIPVIRSQIAAGIEIIVQLYRDIKGIRRVEKISEVTGADGDMVKMHMLYERDIRERLVKKDELQKTAKRDKYRKYLEERTKTKKDIL